MIESIIVILLIIAIILLIFSFEWESLSLSIIDTIMWFVLGISIFVVEIPYQYYDGSVAQEAVQTLESMYPIGWLFIGIGLIMMIHTFVISLELLKGKKTRML